MKTAYFYGGNCLFQANWNPSVNVSTDNIL